MNESSLKDYINDSDNKILSYMWTRLIDYDNFIIPESIEEYRQYALKASISVSKQEFFFKEEAVKTLKMFCKKIHTMLADRVSFNTVYNHTKKVIEKVINSKVNGEDNNHFNYYLQSLLNEILSEVHHFRYYRAIYGIKLEGIEEVFFGKTKIFLFSDQHKEEFLSDPYATNIHFLEAVDRYITKYLIGNFVIMCSYEGDKSIANERTLDIMGQSVDLLRFLFCVVYHDYVHLNRIKINLSYPEPERPGSYIALNEDNQAVVGWDSSTKTKEFIISKNLLDSLCDSYMLMEWTELLSRDEKSEIEKALLTSSHWIGEAQAELSRHIAFLKYWTAIEALIIAPANRKGFTKRMLILISKIVFQGPYRFDYKSDKAIYDELNSLYAKRSKISHEGYSGTISAQEVTGICDLCISFVMQVMALNVLHKPCFSSLEALWNCFGDSKANNNNINKKEGAYKKE